VVGVTVPPEREFSHPDLVRLTPDLTGAERLAVYLGLPEDLRVEADRELDRRIEAQSREIFALLRLDDSCTARELADEIAMLWRDECSRVPAGMVAGREPRPAPGPRRQSSEAGTDLDLLRSIPSAEYVPALTGRDVNGAGMVQCPLHSDGQERTPSLHISDDGGGWHCFGCDRGGDVFEFVALLEGRQVPTGREFFEFSAELARALLGATA